MYKYNNLLHYLQDKDPAVWSGSGQAAMREVTELRYSLLPYLYTLFYRAHIYNELVLRPLFFMYAEIIFNAYNSTAGLSTRILKESSNLLLNKSENLILENICSIIQYKSLHDSELI